MGRWNHRGVRSRGRHVALEEASAGAVGHGVLEQDVEVLWGGLVGTTRSLGHAKRIGVDLRRGVLANLDPVGPWSVVCDASVGNGSIRRRRGPRADAGVCHVGSTSIGRHGADARATSGARRVGPSAEGSAIEAPPLDVVLAQREPPHLWRTSRAHVLGSGVLVGGACIRPMGPSEAPSTARKDNVSNECAPHLVVGWHGHGWSRGGRCVCLGAEARRPDVVSIAQVGNSDGDLGVKRGRPHAVDGACHMGTFSTRDLSLRVALPLGSVRAWSILAQQETLI